MINNININIQLDLQGLSDLEYEMILKLFIKNINDSDLSKTISLEELDNVLRLSGRKFLTESMEFPDFTPNEFDIRETKINIIG